jgi:hypothetical protein
MPAGIEGQANRTFCTSWLLNLARGHQASEEQA